MATFPGTWALCGGWAVDAWVGRPTREHHDVEVALFEEDQRTLFERLCGWGLIGHDDHVADDSTEPWEGRRLELPAHVHARSPDGFEPEFHLNERAGGDWVLERRPHVALPIRRAIARSAWGLPTVAPEVALYYKALPPTWRNLPRSAPRAHDERDLRTLLPLLAADRREWLRDTVALVDADHPWVKRLSRAP